MQRDRRRSKRYPLDSAFRFRIVSPSEPERASDRIPGRIHDISDRGMRFQTNTVQSNGLHIFQPNPVSSEQCVLELEVPHGDPPLVLRGRVVWYDRNPDGSAYSFQAGVSFLDLDRDTQKRIHEAIRQLVVER